MKSVSRKLFDDESQDKDYVSEPESSGGEFFEGAEDS